MQAALDVAQRLSRREALSPDDLTATLRAREAAHGLVPFVPSFSADKLFPGTYYLDSITAKYERIYRRKPMSPEQIKKLESLRVLFPAPSAQSCDDLDDSMVEGLDIDDVFDSESVASSVALIGRSKPSSGSFLSGLDRVSSKSKLTHSVTQVWASGRPNIKVVVTGISAALPGRDHEVFPPGVNNVRRIIDGESFITCIPNGVKDAMIEKNVATLVKNKDGSTSTHKIASYDQTINVCASIGSINLAIYGISESIVSTMDRAVQVAIAAGLEALKDARIVTGVGEGTSGWELPEHFRNTTGVVYATSFPALDTAIAEVSEYFCSKLVTSVQVKEVIDELRRRLQKRTGTLSADSESALEQLEKLVAQDIDDQVVAKPYQFDRKFLFRVLVLGNAQLAQIIKARGPNMQTNAACAGTASCSVRSGSVFLCLLHAYCAGATQAIALAYDMIQVGRAERVIVIAGDSASSDNLMPWLGNGFRILGAACIQPDASSASRPFSSNRSGMILGSGGIGMVLESEEGARRRYANLLAASSYHPSVPPPPMPFRCRLLGNPPIMHRVTTVFIDDYYLMQQVPWCRTQPTMELRWTATT